ncbi:hypothetical protein VTH06DRAFT_4699 [Thermothelomyces fergusii]
MSITVLSSPPPRPVLYPSLAWAEVPPLRQLPPSLASASSPSLTAFGAPGDDDQTTVTDTAATPTPALTPGRPRWSTSARPPPPPAAGRVTGTAG